MFSKKTKLFYLGLLWFFLASTGACQSELPPEGYPSSPRRGYNSGVERGAKLRVLEKEALITPFDWLSLGESKPLPKTFPGGPKSFVARRVVVGRDDINREIFGIYLRPSSASGPGPTLIALHPSTGLSKEFLTMTLAFVSHGYRVFALDLYGSVPRSASEGELLEEMLARGSTSKIQARIELTIDHCLEKLGASKIGLIGWRSAGRWLTYVAIEPGLDDSAQRFALTINIDGDPEVLLDRYLDLERPYIGVFGTRSSQISQTTLDELDEILLQRQTANLFLWESVDQGFMEPYMDSYDESIATQVTTKLINNIRLYLGR